MAHRAKQNTQTRMTMGLFEEWGLENDRRRAERDQAAAEEDENRRGVEASGRCSHFALLTYPPRSVKIGVEFLVVPKHASASSAKSHQQVLLPSC